MSALLNPRELLGVKETDILERKVESDDEALVLLSGVSRLYQPV